MSGDERNWTQEAFALCKAANEAKITIFLVRMQDQNNEADIIVTNATTPEMLIAAARIISAESSAPENE